MKELIFIPTIVRHILLINYIHAKNLEVHEHIYKRCPKDAQIALATSQKSSRHHNF